MSRPQIGIKIYPDIKDKIIEFCSIADFIELYITPDIDLESFIPFKKYIRAVHTAHDKHGFNPSLLANIERNLHLIQQSIQSADVLEAEFNIVHPGHVPTIEQSEEGKKNMLDFFDECWHPLLRLENCPLKCPEGCFVFCTPTEMKEFTTRYNTSFNLDNAHATITANLHKKDPDHLIKEFLKLEPDYMHMAGLDYDSIDDPHTHLKDSKNDYAFLSEIRHLTNITLETDYFHSRSLDKLREDIEVILSQITQPFPC
jgi:endonuclease IV